MPILSANRIGYARKGKIYLEASTLEWVHSLSKKYHKSFENSRDSEYKMRKTSVVAATGVSLCAYMTLISFLS